MQSESLALNNYVLRSRVQAENFYLPIARKKSHSEKFKYNNKAIANAFFFFFTVMQISLKITY